MNLKGTNLARDHSEIKGYARMIESIIMRQKDKPKRSASEANPQQTTYPKLLLKENRSLSKE